MLGPASKLDELLRRLPEIAKVVNAFSSERAQLRALAALLEAAGQDREKPIDDPTGVPAARKKAATPRPGVGASVAKHDSRPRPPGKTADSRRSKSADPKIVADLNLRPRGKKSFRDFFNEKSPSSNEEAFAVIIYYLTKVHPSPVKVSADHVYTAFKDIPGRRVPLRLSTVISNSAKRQGWISTKDGSDLKLTTNGENFVEHDLPRKKSTA